jgi:aryl-alcohol dehydrogenase-like predicted oxidoreductase
MRRDWALGAEEAREHFSVALEAGVNFFDTARRLLGGRERRDHRALAQ